MRELSTKGATLLSEVVQRALFTTRSAGAAVALLDGEEMFTSASCGESVPPAGARSPISGFTGLAIHKRETLVCDDTQADSRVDATVCNALNVRSMAVAPIKVNGNVEGVFAIFFNSPRGVSRMHIAMLRTLADVAAGVLEREPVRKSSFLAAKSSAAIAPDAAPVDNPAPPVVSNLADLPAAPKETDPPAALLVATIAPAPQPKALPRLQEPTGAPPKPLPVASLGWEQPASPVRKREELQVLPAAADPMSKPFSCTRPEDERPAPLKGHVSARIQAEARVPLKAVRQEPLFQAFSKETPRRRRTLRVLLPVAGIAAIVIAIAGLVLYRSPGVKATSMPVSADISKPAPAASPMTSTVAEEAAPAAAPITSTVAEQAAPAVALPAARPTIHAAETSNRFEAQTSKQAAESTPREPAMLIRSSTAETRASIASQPVEAPPVIFAPADKVAALAVPAPGPPAARAAVFEPAKVTQMKRPIYPPFARTRQLQGTVVLQLKISKDGRVIEATRIKGDPVLAKAAVDAVKSWRYQPATRDGVPVESEAEVSVNFQL